MTDRGRLGMALALLAACVALGAHLFAGEAAQRALAAASPAAPAAPSAAPSPSAAPPAGPALSAQAQLGQLAFHDVSLSASGRQSCATCHDAASGHVAPNDLAVQLGGVDLDRPGSRSAQPIRYLRTNGAFGFDAEGKARGGFFWDGRAASLEEQAKGPFTNPVEMANINAAEVVARLSRSGYAAQFERLHGAAIWQDPERAFDRLAAAIAAFEREDPAFAPFTSRYDDVLRGKARLTPAEQRGLALFKDPAKGNCAACHTADKGPDGSLPLFTDFSYDNLGVPRNPALAHNRDAAYFDLGLCARAAGDLASRRELCGAFKVPSLRNVAERKRFFHNGSFTSLREVLRFYVQRDTHPERWYSRRADGSIAKFDDLPPHLHGNVNTAEGPYDRKPGDQPALDDAEIEDVLAFLATLSDRLDRPAQAAAR